MSEDLRRIDPEWIKKQSDSKKRNGSQKKKRKKSRKELRPEDQGAVFIGSVIKKISAFFIGLGVVAIALGLSIPVFIITSPGDGEASMDLLGIPCVLITVGGVIAVLIASLCYGIGVMVEKSVENTRNTTQMLALMKQMMRMMEQQTASAAPDENGPQHAEEQAD